MSRPPAGRCPTCGRGPPGTQACSSYTRVITCNWCGETSEQKGPGRTRIICAKKKCQLKQRRFRRKYPWALEHA